MCFTGCHLIHMVLVPVLHSHSKRHQAADPGADRECASAVEEIVEIVAGEVVCNARTGDRRQHGWTCTYLPW